MSSESLLKDQYNTLINEQKTKLEQLREKKKLMNQQKNNEQSERKFNIDNEINSEMKKVDDYDQELFAKLDNLDLMDSSDDDTKAKNQKLLIKKYKKSPTENVNKEPIKQDVLDSVRESLSYADRLREIQDENGRLRKVLAEKEYEIGYLKRKLDEEASLTNIGSISGDGATASKIVELAKKVRELTASLESEKTKNKQLTKTCVDLETRLQNVKSRRADADDDDDDDDGGGDNEDVEDKKTSLVKENRELKEKLNQISHKMMEFKSQCEILKQDLKKTQKALEKEVGDNVDIKAILSGQSNWRGRQQQITNLQTKVADLKQQLGGVMDMTTRQSQMFIVDEELTIDEQCEEDGHPKSAQPSVYSTTFNMSASSVRTNLNSRHRNDLKHLENQKKEQYEKLKREYDAMEGDYGSMKEKLEASKARNKVLANENKTHKDQIKTLLEKGKHDDELIEALLKKQAQMKEMLESLSQQHDKTTKELEEKAVQSQVKNMQEKNTIEQMKLIISEREKRVNELEEELGKLKEAFYASFNNKHSTQSNTNDGFFLNDKVVNKTDSNENESEFIKSRPMSSSRATNTPTPLNRTDSMLEREVSSSRFNLKSAKGSGKPPATYQSQHQSQQSHRQNQQSHRANQQISNNQHQSQQTQQQRPSSTSSLVSAKTAVEQKKENQVDLKLENSELKTLYKSSEIERVRLLELVKSQQKRIEELNEKALETENRLNEERRRCANLEKQIERIKLIDTNKNTYSNKYGKSLAAQSNAPSTIDQYKLEELETSLLIQKDENEAIKAALKSTLEAKEEDLRLYCEMLETTKKVFLDGIKSYKQIAALN